MTTPTLASNGHESHQHHAITSGTGGEWLTFRIGGEEYGIDILRVQEIRGHEEPTRIANAPDYLRGVCNLRGVIVPIVDLRMRLGASSAEFGGTTVTVILNFGARVVGMVVDAVSDVVRLSPGEVRPAPEMASAISADFIEGIGSLRNGDEERMLILLDIEGFVGSASFGLVRPVKH